MAGEIAILGWGSLQWRSDGPALRIEFSRISKTRNGALTLAIDAGNPVPVQVSWCLSSRTDIGEAVEDLRKPEGMPSPRWIGRYPQDRWQPRLKRAEAFRSISDWARSPGLCRLDRPGESDFRQRIGIGDRARVRRAGFGLPTACPVWARRSYPAVDAHPCFLHRFYVGDIPRLHPFVTVVSGSPVGQTVSAEADRICEPAHTMSIEPSIILRLRHVMAGDVSASEKPTSCTFALSRARSTASSPSPQAHRGDNGSAYVQDRA
jgi:hypothetical protein